MAKFETTVIGNDQAVLKRLHEAIMGGGWSMALVDESDVRAGDVNVYTRVYDKYFMRTSSRASLTLVLVSLGGSIHITAIGAGSGTGVLEDSGVGAEESLVSIVENVLSEN